MCNVGYGGLGLWECWDVRAWACGGVEFGVCCVYI